MMPKDIHYHQWAFKFPWLTKETGDFGRTTVSTQNVFDLIFFCMRCGARGHIEAKGNFTVSERPREIPTAPFLN